MKEVIKKVFTAIFMLFVTNNLFAYKVIDDVATSVEGYDIPIKILLPDNTIGKCPVHFHVHGGGWNGGTVTQVPKVNIPGDANILCDRLGIIYVCLAYRCKGNNATFTMAIEDLEASVKWFMDRAKQYKADLSRIGFGGSSAGTTLSAIMAQKYVNCKVYIGSEGMYNILDQDSTLSFFPTSEGKKRYGLITPEQQRNASPYYNLRKKPASALLFHGKDDFLCHHTQSDKYAKKIKQEGGTCKVVKYEGINHTCLNVNYPEVYKNSVMEMALFYVEEFKIKNTDINAIELAMDKAIKPHVPYEKIPQEKLLGKWKGKHGIFILQLGGKGQYLNTTGTQKQDLTYFVYDSCFSIKLKGQNQERIFYLRQSDRFIFELILADSRFKSRRFDYRKQDN